MISQITPVHNSGDLSKSIRLHAIIACISYEGVCLLSFHSDH